MPTARLAVASSLSHTLSGASLCGCFYKLGGVLIIGAALFGVCIGAPDFGNSHVCEAGSPFGQRVVWVGAARMRVSALASVGGHSMRLHAMQNTSYMGAAQDWAPVEGPRIQIPACLCIRIHACINKQNYTCLYTYIYIAILE